MFDWEELEEIFERGGKDGIGVKTTGVGMVGDPSLTPGRKLIR